MGVNGIYGLSGSGMDIESLVKVGMMKKQNEYDKMAQKYTKNEWTKSAYLELNNNISTFNMSTLSQYKMSANMNAKTVEYSSTAFKAVANASAGTMNHKVKVEEIGSNAHLISTGGITRINTDGGSINKTSIKLKDILFKSLTEGTDTTTDPDTGETTTTKNGKISGQSVTQTFSDLKLTDKAITFYLSDGVTKNDNGSTLKQAEISFTFDEVLNGEVTLNDLASKINNAGLNIRASFDSVNETFSMYNSKGGDDNTISIKTATNYASTPDGETPGSTTGRVYHGTVTTEFFNSLNMYQSVNGELYGIGGETTKDAGGSALHFAGHNSSPDNKLADGTKAAISGTSGSIRVDGISYKTTDNKVTVGGITYTALEKMADTTPSATVSVTQDVDAIVDKVKSFVADYNKILSGLYEKYDEKPESGYSPLTQSQKDAMKEEQITKWEEKAKKGLLYHDQTIGKIINEMRSAINTPIDSIEGKYNSAYSIGIGTTGLKGQLTLDEDKLRKALNDDPDAVYNVFAKLDNSKKDKSGSVINNPEGNGIAQRIGDILTTAQKNIKSRAGSSTDITEDSDLNTLLRQLQTKMSNFKKLMNSFEDKLYSKYDKMESTLAGLGAQLNFIAGSNQ